MISPKAYSAVVLLAVLAVAAITACSFAAAAPSAGQADGTIVVSLPESHVALQIDSGGFCRFTGTGIQYIGQTGEPSTPSQSVRVLLPPDADPATVKATVTGYRWTGIDGKWDIPPVGPLAIGDGEDTGAVSPTDEAIINAKDPGIYESDALFPTEPIVKVDVQVFRGWKMAQVFYAPYAYNPVEKKVFQLSGTGIEVTFGETSLKTNSASADLTSASTVQDMTVNFAEMSGEYGGYAVSADTGRYVIITTSAIQAASTKLADFVASTEARGFTVQVATEGTWGGGTGNAAAENIRSWLKANYSSLNIKYVLLIGNPNPASGTVPMKMCYPQKYDANYLDCPTDFYYAELTSNNWDKDGDGKYGEYQDDFSGSPPRTASVAVGRIPYYGSITDLDHILSKIIDYENAPAASTSWRENALLPMKPSDSQTPGYQLGEEIKSSILTPNGWTYHRLYDQYNTVYCNPGDPGYVLNIPADTETVGCTVDNVTNDWNSSDYGAVIWWTHGSETSAASVMDLTHTATLDDAHPGFVFQCSCLNGSPETTTNLGYTLLKKGCVSTVAASRVSWYIPGQTDFAGTATNSGMAFEYAERLIADKTDAGDALNGLKADISPGFDVLWMNYLDFNLYGDPAVGLFTFTPSQAAPTVLTYDSQEVASTSALLRGNLTSLGTAASDNVSFELGTTSGAYTYFTENQTMSAIGEFSDNLTGLTPGTTYYYRAVAAGDGTTIGDPEASFQTLGVTTGAADNITATSARLHGHLTALGSSDNVTVSFEYGTTPSYGNFTDNQTMSSAGDFSDDLTGLAPGTTYYYRAKAVGDWDAAYGLEGSFHSLAPPAVTTVAADNITATSARLNGDLTSLGTAASDNVYFEWGLTTAYGNSTTPVSENQSGSFSADLTSGISGKTTYHFRAVAVGDGTTYGGDENFTTPTVSPTVTTDDPSEITVDGARLNGILNNLGTAGSVTVSFGYSLTAGGPYLWTEDQTLSGGGEFSSIQLNGLLEHNTTYYCRARAVGDGTYYGEEKSFTTGTVSPAVITNAASDITTTSATLYGNLTSLGTGAYATVSFEWETAGGSYTPIGERVTASPGTFSVSLTSLTPGITYYYRAKAAGDGSNGSVWGEQMSFTTLSPPSVTTGTASDLTSTSAKLNGNLASMGSAGSVTVSFEYGTISGGPYTYVAVADGVRGGTGAFSADLGGLTPGTMYYFRAVAGGAGDPARGAVESFTTLKPPVVAGVAPASGEMGQSLTVTIIGTGFTGATAVSFGSDVVVDKFTEVSATEISAAIRITCDGAAGTRDVSVTTPGGADTLEYGFFVDNSAPNQPLNEAPANKTSVMTLSPTLSSSAFSHPCQSRTQAASQWRVRTALETYAKSIFDSGTDARNLTSIVVPEGTLDWHIDYYWQVRYQDDRGVWSDWSDETVFMRLDVLSGVVDGPAAMRATDSSSRVTGLVDSQTEEQIPSSHYYDGAVTIFSPGDSYVWEVVGTGDGSYSLTVIREVEGQSVAFHAVDIPVAIGEVHRYVIDWGVLSQGGKGVTIEIDADGDGTIDRTAVVGAEATSHSFASGTSRHGIPSWAWALLAISVVAGLASVFVLWRMDRNKRRNEAMP